MNLQARRLMAWCLTDDNLLNELADDRHQRALCIFIRALARHPHELPHRHLCFLRIMAPTQLLDLGSHVRAGFRETGDLLLQRLSLDFEPVERVVECRQARTALGRTVTDLLRPA